MSEDLILTFIPPGLLLTLKIIAAVFSAAFLAVIIILIHRTSWLKIRYVLDAIEFFTARPYGTKKIEKVWAKISARLEGHSDSEYKLAIIEADSLLNEILERINYKGETLGERLQKLTADTLPSIEEVWEAHKIRNNIVHDPDYKVTLDEAKKAITIYGKALQDLEAL